MVHEYPYTCITKAYKIYHHYSQRELTHCIMRDVSPLCTDPFVYKNKHSYKFIYLSSTAYVCVVIGSVDSVTDSKYK